MGTGRPARSSAIDIVKYLTVFPGLWSASLEHLRKSGHGKVRALDVGVIPKLFCFRPGCPNMSNPLDPRLYDLQKPEKLSKILKEDKDDCLSCRLVGQLHTFLLISN